MKLKCILASIVLVFLTATVSPHVSTNPTNDSLPSMPASSIAVATSHAFWQSPNLRFTLPSAARANRDYTRLPLDHRVGEATKPDPVAKPRLPVQPVSSPTTAPIQTAHQAPKPHIAPRVTKPSVQPAVGTGAAAQAYAKRVLGNIQFACLAHIVLHEDATWNPLLHNYGGSGAYGIPQALPGSKMASAGADWRTNAVTQIKWMISYITSRYGSACGAWQFWQRHSWY